MPVPETAPSSIRSLVVADLFAVERLEQRLFSHPWMFGQFETSLRAGHLLLGCEIKQRLVGYLVVSYGGGVADLLTIGVDTALQGTGLSQELLDSAIAALRSFDVEELLLEVRASNQRALGFYLKNGFEQVGVRKDYYPAESGREDALVFKRHLACRA